MSTPDMQTSVRMARRYACDVHTHTVYSRHAYSTIEENVRVAADRGIELLGSTDHFSDMLWPKDDVRNFQYLDNYHCWPRMWHGVHLLRGVEADIVDLDGHLFGWDVPVEHDILGRILLPTTQKQRSFSRCDYVIASVHNKGIAAGASLAETTNMYIRALEDPKVLIIGHPGRSGVPFDLDEVLAAARDMHKLIELNEYSLGAPWNRDRSYDVCRRIAIRCAETATPVAISTDAHISVLVGRFVHMPAMLDEIDFPPELIATRSAAAFFAALDAAGLAVH